MATSAVSKYQTQVKIATAAGSAKTLTAITKAASAVCTSTGHGLTVGTVVVFANAGGMVEINGMVGIITAQDTNTFTVNINSSSFSTYTSGGTATSQTMTLIENCTNFERSGDEADRMDATNLMSIKKEYLIGLAGEGTISIPIDIDASGPGQKAARELVGVDTQVALTVTRRDGKTESMAVKFTNISEGYPDKHTGTFSGVVTGPVGWYA